MIPLPLRLEQSGAAVRRLGDAFLRPHREWLLATRRPDGAFPDRAGNASLYYTRFGLRALDLCGVDDAALAVSIPWLEQAASALRDVPDVFCLLDSFRLLHRRGLLALSPESRHSLHEAAAACLARFRQGDGYHRHPDEPASLAVTFLGVCSERMAFLEDTPPRPPVLDDGVLASLLAGRRTADGGFSDLGLETDGQAVATAAAIGIASFFADKAEEEFSKAVAFFTSLRRPDGGFVSSRPAPRSDLLSTFSVLASLDSLQALATLRLAESAAYFRTLSRHKGGFSGDPADTTPDSEYTYYGAASLGILSNHISNPIDSK